MLQGENMQLIRGCRLRWYGLAFAGLIAAVVALARPAEAYVIVTLPTLGYTTAESNYVMLVRVEKVSREKGVIIYQKVRDLRGKYPKESLKHAFNLKEKPAVATQMYRPDVADWSYVLQWAEPGKEAVIFIRKQNNGGDSSLTYIDQCWYASSSTTEDWVWFHTLYTSPDLLRNYFCGSPARLAAAVDAMVALGANRNGSPVVPTLQEGRVADLRAGQAKIRGLRVGGGLLDFNLKRDTADWEDAKAAEALVDKLKGQDAAVRLQAAKELEHWFGPEVKSALPALTACLKHEDRATRRAAAAALGNYHLAASDAIPALCTALKDEDTEVAVKAAESLAALREKGKNAIPALREATKAAGVRGEAAAAALVCINPEIETESPEIAKLLQSRASVGGKYRNQLMRIKVPQDLTGRQFFRDQALIVGISPPAADYRGHKGLPQGYWVYVYPYWYIWGEQSAPK
jgi:hypothetical protein